MNKKLKINIDRHVVSSEEIASRRNFESVLIQAKSMRKPFYKSPGFIGGTLLGLVLLSLLWWQLASNSVDPQKHSSNHKSKAFGAATVRPEQNNTNQALTNIPSPKQLGRPIASKHFKKKEPLVHFKGISPGIPFTIYKINSGQNSSFTHGKGSIVDIPAGSFRRIKDKKVVTGPVDIHYREFSDAFEILMAGITMQYDTAGHAHQLQSAGMMEIRGFQNGEALEFVPGKSIKVSLASDITSTDYNVYQLDDVHKQWAYRGKDTVSPLQMGSAGGVQREEENPFKKIQDDVFKANVLKPVKKKDGVQNFKLTLTGKSRYKWPYYNGVYFELSPKSKKLGKEQYDVSWNNVEIEPGRDSTLMKVRFTQNILKKVKTKDLRKKSLESPKLGQSKDGRIIPPIYVSDNSSKYTIIPDTLIFEVEAYPVYDQKDSAYVMGLYQKQVDKQKEDFDAWLKLRDSKRKADSLAFEKNRISKGQIVTGNLVLRSFSIGNFGTFNCDQIYRSQPNRSFIFHLVDQNGEAINSTVLSLVYPSIRTVFTNSHLDKTISVNDRIKLIFITVMANGDIAYMPYEEFLRLSPYETELTLKMTIHKNDFKTSGELKAFLMGL